MMSQRRKKKDAQKKQELTDEEIGERFEMIMRAVVRTVPAKPKRLKILK